MQPSLRSLVLNHTAVLAVPLCLGLAGCGQPNGQGSSSGARTGAAMGGERLEPGDGGSREPKIYGNVSATRYLTGQFNPRKHDRFVTLKSLGIPASRRMYVRRETGRALARMYRAFRKAHPRVPFRIVSATRNFYTQKAIWEAKWKGRRQVEGRFLPRSIPEPVARGKFILRYSSMPGTSRHHWGTDVDITNLNNEWFRKGKGLTLLRWLEANAGRFGFCRPYTAGRSAGYLEESWHWSYRPLAVRFLRDWNRRYRDEPQRFAVHARFAGGPSLYRLAPIYVNSINSDCK